MQVLVIIFGERACMWQLPARLLPFKHHLPDKLAEGRALIEAKRMARPELFLRAVQVGGGSQMLRPLSKALLPFQIIDNHVLKIDRIMSQGVHMPCVPSTCQEVIA